MQITINWHLLPAGQNNSFTTNTLNNNESQQAEFVTAVFDASLSLSYLITHNSQLFSSHRL